ncbi:MAG TPA: methylenetetrahydromethanopterin dehydrogenase [Firmicutes bacterium]|nr:methylenetetrahydromethanopterin dehydrogenase [Bacillota bacterium]
MKKLLVQLDTDSMPSVFDGIVAYDAGVDHVLPYGGVTPDNVQDLVYGAMFTRGGDKLKNTAIFVGGSRVEAAQAVVDKIKETFFGPVRVSVLMDANGCNTTAAAAVLKMNQALPVKGKRALVLAGTGPVGMRAAGLLALEGAQVGLTSRSLERGEHTCRLLRELYGVEVTPYELDPRDQEAVAQLLAGVELVLAAGPPGAVLLEEETWTRLSQLQVVADINAVPPGGIPGIKPTDDGKERHGKICFGALGIGGLKMKLHKAALQRLFTANDLVLDAREVYALGKEL